MLKIRPIEYQDRTAWTELYKQYLTFYKTSLSDEQLQTVWEWFFNSQANLYGYVAILEDNFVGLVHFREFLRPIKATMGFYMDDLFVDPLFRGQGIARALIETVEKIASQKKSTLVRWMTASDNHKAMNVYDKLATKTSWVVYDMTVEI